MRRVVAVVTAVAVLGLTSVSALMHVHGRPGGGAGAHHAPAAHLHGHRHAHQHGGPAGAALGLVHRHTPPRPAVEGAAEWAVPDHGGSVISADLSAVSVHAPSADGMAVPSLVVHPPRPSALASVAPPDQRAHAPPSRAGCPPRAPPASSPV